MEIQKALGLAIKEIRLSKQLTQEFFSDVSSRTYMSVLEGGKKSPSVEKINDLANAMGIHPLTILTLSYLIVNEGLTLATGIATGLPANPWIALPSAVFDVAATLKLEVLAAARVAIIYDADFFNNEDATWELLIPIFGLNIGSQALRELGVRGGMGLTRAGIKKYLSKETLKTFKKIMLKYFGIKVTQKGIITKMLPIAGGLIGGTWNYLEISGIKKRTLNYFEGKEI